MQYFTTDEYVQQLPRCSGCLQDFGTAQYPVLFVCKHIYCSLCLQRLKENSGAYRCLYDGILTPAESAKEDLGFYNRLDYFRRFLQAHSEVSADIIQVFAQIKKEINYSQVACRRQVDTDSCLLRSICPYSHSCTSLEIARNFRDSEVEECWECKRCLLTLTRKLEKCPVCDGFQEAKRIYEISEGNFSRKDTRKKEKSAVFYPPLNFKPAISAYRSVKVRPVEEEAKSSTNPPDTARKQKEKQRACCQLQ